MPITYSRPFWAVSGAHFPPNDVTHRPNPKRTVLGRNHAIWAIKREYRSRGSSWACVREKKDRTGQDRKKATKGLYFIYLGRSPHWSDVHENLFSRWCSRRNHVCQVSKWNFKGLRFYRGRIFHVPIDFLLGLTTVQRYCAACDTCRHKSHDWSWAVRPHQVPSTPAELTKSIHDDPLIIHVQASLLVPVRNYGRNNFEILFCSSSYFLPGVLDIRHAFAFFF